ncbi:MAG: nucleotidyltransferase family protein [Chloroflexota bacterium]
MRRLRERADVVAVVLFGSYARGQFGRSSDVDLLVLVEGDVQAQYARRDTTIPRIVGEVEAQARLPMQLSPLVASVDRPDELGADLLHAVWTDGIVLYARANALARLQAPGLAPWVVVRFSVARAKPHERVRLSRRLHGTRDRPGIVRLPGITLAPGALLVPADQQQAVRDALDDVGATYDLIPVWRET